MSSTDRWSQPRSRPNARYSSFDYCFNQLASPKSCEQGGGGSGPSTPHDIARAYQERTATKAGRRSWLVPVRRKPTHQPLYYLLFFTRHPDGMWAFGEALSKAQEQAEWGQPLPAAGPLT